MVRERHQDDINVFLNRIYSTPHFLGNSCQSDRRRTEKVAYVRKNNDACNMSTASVNPLTRLSPY